MILISLLVGALEFHGYRIDRLTMADSFKITGVCGIAIYLKLELL